MHQFKWIFAALSLVSGAAYADNALLAQLVETNPALRAVHAEVEAARADLWSARGQRLPQLRVEAQSGRLEETFTVDGAPGDLTATRDPQSAAAVVDQALFTSGRIGGAINAAKAEAQQAEHHYNAARQDLILAGATTMSDYVRDLRIVEERRINEQVVRERLQESQARREVGLATVTDIRQSQARLALAEAERITAEAVLHRSEAAFARLFGSMPDASLVLPAAPVVLPNSLDQALAIATRESPDLAAQASGEHAARQNVRSERGRLLPQVSLNAQATYAEEERFGIELGEAEQYGVFLQGRWDIFSGGSGYARTRAAKRRALAQEERTRNIGRVVREQTIAAWSDVLAGRSVVLARKTQVQAASIAAEGVEAEFRNGRRTRLDVLDADREATDAEVGLLSAQRDLIVAEFALLRAIGRL